MIAIAILVLFWVAVVFAFFVLNAKTALGFAGLWAVGLFVASFLHANPFVFLAYETLLAACLCFMLKREWS